ncbi:MAG: winged helix-turn-helix domain-containing protein [Pyrinomonadaceae bacterium]|nr:winged helix-turn-helix domain-containing protein [Pyrinomonadaceae bacterium]
MKGVFFEFEGFRLEPGTRSLLLDGTPIRLTPKAFDLLALLVRRAPEVVSRQEILAAIWPDTFVEEGNINYTISHLRKALGDRELIRTVPKAGYRFVGIVKAVPAVIEQQTVTESDTDAVIPRSAGRRRYQRAAVWLAIAVICVFLVTGYRSFNTNRDPEIDTQNIRSIAVLPFLVQPDTRVDAEELSMAAAAIGERIGLARGLSVRPAEAVARSGAFTDPVAAGSAIGVDTVVTGSLASTVNGPVLEIRLTDVKSSAEIWKETVAAPDLSLAGLHGDIASRIVTALFSRLDDADLRRIKNSHTRNAEAYRHYAAGRAIFKRSTSGSFEQILDHYNRAVTLDPAFALAYAGLADLFFRRGSGADGTEADELYRRAESYARKAIDLDPELSHAHTAIGRGHRALRKDFDAAEASFRRAIEFDPNNVQAYGFLGQILILKGDHAGALKIADRVEHIDPNAHPVIFLRYRAFEAANENAKGLAFAERAFSIDPQIHYARISYVKFLYYSGNYERAVEVANEGLTESKGFAFVWHQMLARAKFRLNDRAGAMQHIDAMTKGAESSTKYLYHLAAIDAENGSREKALAALEKCLEENEEWMVWMNSEPAFDSIRVDPRFSSMLGRMNLRTN